MHCNGKCYLMKKLKDAEEKEKKQEQDAKKNTQDVFIVSTPLAVVFEQLSVQKKRPVALDFRLPKISAEIPHPPPSIVANS